MTLACAHNVGVKAKNVTYTFSLLSESVEALKATWNYSYAIVFISEGVNSI